MSKILKYEGDVTSEINIIYLKNNIELKNNHFYCHIIRYISFRAWPCKGEYGFQQKMRLFNIQIPHFRVKMVLKKKNKVQTDSTS